MFQIRRLFWLVLIPSLLFAVSSCAPPELVRVRIGFVGGLSGRANDLGIDGINGVRLAVESRNRAGGINGRPIMLFEADDRQDPQATRQAVSRLIDNGVEAIVGPMTSTMAVATVPLTDAAKRVMISPTMDSDALSGRDDYFFRTLPPARRIRIIYDLRNEVFSESWENDFSRLFTAAGGKTLEPIGFTETDDAELERLVRRALQENPEDIYLVANSVDTVAFCQIIRKLDPSIAIGTSLWASTERLLRLGRNIVEGIFAAQIHDIRSPAPSFLKLHEAFLKRFHQEPSFASVFAYDAANMIFDALEKKPRGQSLKQALLSQRTFPGLQTPIVFDAYGDSQRETFISTVKNGEFLPIRAHPEIHPPPEP